MFSYVFPKIPRMSVMKNKNAAVPLAWLLQHMANPRRRAQGVQMVGIEVNRRSLRATFRIDTPCQSRGVIGRLESDSFDDSNVCDILREKLDMEAPKSTATASAAILRNKCLKE